jgi:hypothetical protein
MGLKWMPPIPTNFWRKAAIMADLPIFTQCFGKPNVDFWLRFVTGVLVCM